MVGATCAQATFTRRACDGVDEVETVLIGAGPAAAAAAAVLVERAVSFHWLEAGEDLPPFVDGDLQNLLSSPQAARRTLFGSRFEALGGDARSSPKLRSPALAPVFEAFSRTGVVESRDFTAVGSLSVGGLSNAWGAMALSVDEREWSMPSSVWKELRAALAVLSLDLPISGASSDALARQPPLPLDPTAEAVWRRHRLLEEDPRFCLERPSQAVRSIAAEDAPRCVGCLRCLWGCPSGAVFNAAAAVRRLRSRPGVTWRPGWRVVRITRDQDVFELLGEGAAGTPRSLRARRVLLAAGALTSTLLTADLLGTRESFPIGTTPAFSFAVLIPSRLGYGLRRSGYGMAQLMWSIGAGREQIAGGLYAPSGLPSTEIVRHLPLTSKGRAAFAKLALPAMLIGAGFLPSEYSKNLGQVRREGGRPRLHVRGALADGAAAAAAKAVDVLRPRLMKRGAVLPPMAPTLATPGADVHYGATFPMLGQGGHATDLLGQPGGLDGLHLLDGACLPRLSARNPTLMIMANARRLASAISTLERVAA